MDIDSKELLTGVMTNIAENSIKFSWERVKKFFKDIDAKDSITFGYAYEHYLVNTKRKNSKIKTIIFRHVPKDLYSFYECIGVECDGEIIDTSSICNLLEVDKRIIITGTGGMGKSILFKHLYLNTIEDTDYIPVLIELRSFNVQEIKDISLYDTIYNSLITNGFTLEREYFEFSMKSGAYVILLDGYDEINRDRTEKITYEIKSLCDKYPDNKYFVSSRPTEDFIGWNDFIEMTSLALTKSQALSLIKKIEFEEQSKNSFCRELDNILYDKYRSFASNPLLLNIMLLTFNNHASIPNKLNDFYEEAFSTLFNMHDATKDSYVRDIRTGLGCEEFKHIFAYICFKSYFKGIFEFTETKLREYLQLAKEKFSKFSFSVKDFQEDLTISVCMLVKDGLNYRFSHRSFQEYFAAWYTCKLIDDIQIKLLNSLIRESNSILRDSYFSMLFDMQSEKFNKIILYPGLCQIKKAYDEFGFSLNYLETLFEGVILRKNANSEGEVFYRFSLTIKNRYLCNILMLNNRLNFSSNYGKDSTISNIIANKLADRSLILSNKGYKRYKFDEVLDVITEAELLGALKWFEKDTSYAIALVESNESNNLLRMRKMSSIIDEL